VKRPRPHPTRRRAAPVSGNRTRRRHRRCVCGSRFLTSALPGESFRWAQNVSVYHLVSSFWPRRPIKSRTILCSPIFGFSFKSSAIASTPGPGQQAPATFVAEAITQLASRRLPQFVHATKMALVAADTQRPWHQGGSRSVGTAPKRSQAARTIGSNATSRSPAQMPKPIRLISGEKVIRATALSLGSLRAAPGRRPDSAFLKIKIS
jgi:hypothetical protein